MVLLRNRELVIRWQNASCYMSENCVLKSQTSESSGSPVRTDKPLDLPSIWAWFSLFAKLFFTKKKKKRPKRQTLYLCVASFSSWAFFLQAILSRAGWGELVFPPLRSQCGVWLPQREKNEKTFSQVLEQFYYARGERKPRSVHHCQVKTGFWWSQHSDANQAFHFQECSTFHLYL